MLGCNSSETRWCWRKGSAWPRELYDLGHSIAIQRDPVCQCRGPGVAAELDVTAGYLQELQETAHPLCGLLQFLKVTCRDILFAGRQRQGRGIGIRVTLYSD